MLATTECIHLLDHTDELAKMIIDSEQMVNYIENKRKLKQNKEAQALIKQFEIKKEQYEDVQRFGRYHPDFSQITKEMRMVKREVDMHEAVAQFKVAERDLQALLDDISEKIAHSISKQIIVPRDGALFTDSGCGCGSGGGCGCKAS
ncbi:YlbF family regulator [Amphibacillus jilinensis]|uniref:YlbF family regulator n=1 Tax=Amphibacillus jilinensis TaxID=1216008 RepID=UPI0002DFCDFC|nr:YlbF family regulator [Amphibacillus jilinensis]